MNNAVSRSGDARRTYRAASTQVRILAEQNGITLSERDVDAIVRAYGINRTDNVYGDSNRALIRLQNESGNGRLLDVCRSQADMSNSARLNRTSQGIDDVDRLQEFARAHQTNLSADRADKILTSHQGLMDQPDDKIMAAIEQSNTTTAFKVGSRNLLRSAVVVSSIVKSSNDSEGTGLDWQGFSSQSYDALNELRKKQARAKKLAQKRVQDKAVAKKETEKEIAAAKEAESAGRKASSPSPRQNRVVDTTSRNASGVAKTRSATGTSSVQETQKARAAQKTKGSMSARKKKSVKKLIGKRKAAEKAAEKTAEKASESAVAQWFEKLGTSSVGAIKYVLIGVFIIMMVSIIVGIALIILLGEEATRANLIGDWYDSNIYKNKNFVEVTQDLQRKYYDDCIALAYEVGADAPSESDVKINWKAVYSLWSAIVRYRSGNQRMEWVYTSGDKEVTGYSVSSPVFNLTSDEEAMFPDGGGDDYLQDFYLAFYSMYYDLKAVDSRGNPILYNVSSGERYYPYYPTSSGSTGYNYDYFSSANEFPLKGAKSDTVVKGILTKNKDGSWSIHNGSYKFIYGTARANDENNGYFNRGKPKVSVTFESKEDVFNYPDETAPVFFTFCWTGYSLNYSSGVTLDFNGSNTCGEWKLTNIVQSSNDGTYHSIPSSSSNWSSVRNSLGKSITLSSYQLKNYASGSGPHQCSLCSSGSKQHSHWYYGIGVGDYKDLYYHLEPVRVSYENAKLVYPSPSAQDGLKALHDVYDQVFMKGYGYNGGSYTAFTQGQKFYLGGHWTVSTDTVIESGSTKPAAYNSYHEDMLVVLDQIFDRSMYYPWDKITPRWSSGAPEGLYAYGLPGAGSGSHDCFESIKTSLGYITSSSSGTYPSILPADNYLIASFDSGSDSHVNKFAANYKNLDRESYGSVVEMIATSVFDVQLCFPFCVRYKPNNFDHAGSSWEQGNLTGSIDKAWDVLFFNEGYVTVTWNSVTYLLYRYFVAEQNMCPSAACGILGALQYETFFSKSGYGTVPPVDNNYAYALGLLQWNQGIKPKPNNTNLYDNRLCSWCAEHNLNWRNAGAQLQYLSACISQGEGAGTGNYPVGVYKCQMLELTYAGAFNDQVKESAYTKEDGFPTFSAADSAGTYEACFYWGVYVEGGVEQWGGTYFDSWQRAGYGPSFADKTNPVLLFDLEAYVAYNKNNGSKRYEDRKFNIDKQRMVAAHVFLRYVAASDPDYYSVAYYEYYV